MDVEVLSARSLRPTLCEVWTKLQLSNPDLTSPFFAPEFTMAVAAIRDSVEVAVIKVGNQIVAIFPFQRRTASLAASVAGVLSDYHGLICEPGFNCDLRELLRKCRLAGFDFDHVPASQGWFEPFHRHRSTSPLIDLSQGYEAYAADRRAKGSEQIKKCMNLMRRLEQDVGPLRFVRHAKETGLLAKVLAWKSGQYNISRKPDLLAVGWIRGVLERIHRTEAEGCSGMFSLLYADDRLVAGHMGMRSRTIWHYWFPAYDPQFARYSPGLILLLKMAECAPSIGIRTIDLGMGMSLYKERLMNSSVSLLNGSILLPSWLSFRRAVRRSLRAFVLNTRFEAPARRLIAGLRMKNEAERSNI